MDELDDDAPITRPLTFEDVRFAVETAAAAYGWNPELALPWAVADTKIGRYSTFQNQHGFYVERVGEWTLLNQPAGWEDRALNFVFDGIEVIVLHPLDLAYNKLEAGRAKDFDFMREGLTSGAYQLAEVEAFIRDHAPDDATRDSIIANLHQAL